MYKSGGPRTDVREMEWKLELGPEVLFLTMKSKEACVLSVYDLLLFQYYHSTIVN